MSDATVMKLEEMDGIAYGAFRLVRGSLGVRSFGIAVINLPPGFSDYNEHDHSEDGQEEVFTCLSGRATLRIGGPDGEEHTLEPGTWARVGPTELRTLITGEEPARVLALGGTPDRPYTPPEFSEPGAGEPYWSPAA